MVRAPVSAVSRSTDKIDLFGVDPDGHVITAGGARVKMLRPAR
jgi:hypothetical protein